MRRLLVSAVLIFIAAASAFSQFYSEIKYDAGSSIDIQNFADVCADNIIINGSFSGGGTLCTGPLPVTLTSFNASVNKSIVLLAWRTETELNNSGFSIERKHVNGSSGDWKIISFVKGAGTTSEPQNYTFADRDLQTGNYTYRLKQIDYNGNYEYFDLGSEVTISKPNDFMLGQNYPNPSNPVSKISFQLPEDGNVTLKIYNAIGEEVATLINEFRVAGYYAADFNGSNMASGAYFYRLSAGSHSDIKKLILVK